MIHKFIIIAVSLVFSFPAVASTARDITPINDVYVIHFVLDGLNKTTFDRALSEGKIPTIKETFVDKGATFTHALSLFPSTSMTVYQAYTSGLFPGHAGIPHLERFDREKRDVVGYLTISGAKKIDSDFINLKALLNPSVAEIEPPSTIFELLSGYKTAAIYSSFKRGASFAFPKKAPVRALWATYVTGNIGRVDQLAMRKVMKLFSKDAGKIPRYTLVGLYSADIFGHKYGPQSDDVQNTITQFDLFLRDFTSLLEEKGIADKTYIIVSADHGMHESGELFEFQKALENAGVAVKPKNPRDKKYTLFAANRGVASSHIYVKHDGGFEPIENSEILRQHPTTDGKTVDLIDLILKLDSTDLLIVRAGERRSRVFSSDGKTADIACYTVKFSDFCSYKFDASQGDPLGYDKNPHLKNMLDGLLHPSAEWKDLTAGEKYPDAVTELSQIFHDGRAGDAFIVTKGRWGFRKVKAGNHGGAIEDDMRVPLMISGPKIPRGALGAARAVDIYPLLIEWFGINTSENNSDGINPFEGHPVDKTSMKLAQIEALFDGRPPLLKALDNQKFIREKIAPMIAHGERVRLIALAKEESAQRAMLLTKLNALIVKFDAQKKDKRAPRVADPKYLDDHIKITRRAQKWAAQSSLRMQDIVDVLTKCENPNSYECGRL